MKPEKRIVGKDEFMRRSKGLSRDNLIFVFSVGKAISLSAGTMVLFNIVLNGFNPTQNFDSPQTFILPLGFWLITFCGVLVTYDGAMSGTLFIYHLPRRGETVLTFLMAAFEFLLFAILYPSFFVKEGVRTIFGIAPIYSWFILYALYGLCAFGIITNAMSNIAVEQFKGKKLQKLVEGYKKRVQVQRISSARSAFFSFLFFFVVWMWGDKIIPIVHWPLSFAIGVISIVGFGYAMYKAFMDQHNQRKELEQQLNRL